ncbi:metallophosphoesterase [Candidatus Dojkabacteria bacterium]|nr:metallophosphoesterase [Candidatus Dojkabacteria bacterium]
MFKEKKKFVLIGFLTLILFSLIFSIIKFSSLENASFNGLISIQQEGEVETVLAFVGDSGYGNKARSVFQLIKSEQTNLVVFLGDLAYDEGNNKSAEAWGNLVKETLGTNPPLVTAVGNHDVKYWNKYVEILDPIAKSNLELTCSGEYGVNYFCSYRDFDIVFSGIGILGSGHVDYLKGKLENSTKNWKICAFHKVQNLMQVGGKSDEVGWDIYEECRKQGAILATAHEHSYSRTHLMSSFTPPTIANTDTNIIIEKGKTFAFVSGMAGFSERATVGNLGKNPWWASVYTTNNGAIPSILFCKFKGKNANCYLKNIENKVIDTFTLESKLVEPKPNTYPKCVGLNIYDNSDSFPNVINEPTGSTLTRKLNDTVTVRTVSTDLEGLNQNMICWAPDKLLKEEYFKRSTYVCAVVCGGSSTNGGVCDDMNIFSGHVTNTIGGYINMFNNEYAKEKAKTNGIMFLTNIYENSTGSGLCSTNPGYGENGVYFSKEVLATGSQDGVAYPGVNLNTQCGIAADGKGCIRRLAVSLGGGEVTATPTLIISPNPSASPIPTITPVEVSKNIDLNSDGKINIEDFGKFVSYYRIQDCTIDYNNNADCRDIGDFQIFVSNYADR